MHAWGAPCPHGTWLKKMQQLRNHARMLPKACAAVQVRWHAFQFLTEQLAHEVGALHDRLHSLMRQLSERY